MLFFRSLLFQVLFYLNTTVWLFAIIPTLIMPRVAILRVAQAWGRFSLWLLRITVGTRVEYRGLHHIPAGSCLVAAKHQSLADVLAIVPVLPEPCFVLKRELTLIPLWGWFALKAGMISVDRSKGSGALADMNRQAEEAIRKGRQIMIYPEGTRRPPGAPPAYKQGVAHLYVALGAPCLPVAVNSGVFWPRRKFVMQPGTIVVDFLDVIPPGLTREAFLPLLQERIETASCRLFAETTEADRYRGPDGI